MSVHSLKNKKRRLAALAAFMLAFISIIATTGSTYAAGGWDNVNSSNWNKTPGITLQSGGKQAWESGRYVNYQFNNDTKIYGGDHINLSGWAILAGRHNHNVSNNDSALVLKDVDTGKVYTVPNKNAGKFANYSVTRDYEWNSGVHVTKCQEWQYNKAPGQASNGGCSMQYNGVSFNFGILFDKYFGDGKTKKRFLVYLVKTMTDGSMVNVPVYLKNVNEASDITYKGQEGHVTFASQTDNSIFLKTPFDDVILRNYMQQGGYSGNHFTANKLYQASATTSLLANTHAYWGKFTGQSVLGYGTWWSNMQYWVTARGNQALLTYTPGKSKPIVPPTPVEPSGDCDISTNTCKGTTPNGKDKTPDTKPNKDPKYPNDINKNKPNTGAYAGNLLGQMNWFLDKKTTSKSDDHKYDLSHISINNVFDINSEHLLVTDANSKVTAKGATLLETKGENGEKAVGNSATNTKIQKNNYVNTDKMDNRTIVKYTGNRWLSEKWTAKTGECDGVTGNVKKTDPILGFEPKDKEISCPKQMVGYGTDANGNTYSYFYTVQVPQTIQVADKDHPFLEDWSKWTDTNNSDDGLGVGNIQAPATIDGSWNRGNGKANTTKIQNMVKMDKLNTKGNRTDVIATGDEDNARSIDSIEYENAFTFTNLYEDNYELKTATAGNVTYKYYVYKDSEPQLSGKVKKDLKYTLKNDSKATLDTTYKMELTGHKEFPVGRGLELQTASEMPKADAIKDAEYPATKSNVVGINQVNGVANAGTAAGYLWRESYANKDYAKDPVDLATQSKFELSGSFKYTNSLYTNKDVVTGPGSLGSQYRALPGDYEHDLATASPKNHYGMKYIHNIYNINRYFLPDVDPNFRKVQSGTEIANYNLADVVMGLKKFDDPQNEPDVVADSGLAYQVGMDGFGSIDTGTDAEVGSTLGQHYTMGQDSGFVVEGKNKTAPTVSDYITAYKKASNGKAPTTSDTTNMIVDDGFYYVPVDAESPLQPDTDYTYMPYMAVNGMNDINVYAENTFKFKGFTIGEPNDSNASFVSYNVPTDQVSDYSDTVSFDNISTNGSGSGAKNTNFKNMYNFAKDDNSININSIHFSDYSDLNSLVGKFTNQ